MQACQASSWNLNLKMTIYTYHVQPSLGLLWPTAAQSHHWQTSPPSGFQGSASPSEDFALPLDTGKKKESRAFCHSYSNLSPLFFRKVSVTLGNLVHNVLHMFSIFLLFQSIIWTISMSVRAVKDEKKEKDLTDSPSQAHLYQNKIQSWLSPFLITSAWWLTLMHVTHYLKHVLTVCVGCVNLIIPTNNKCCKNGALQHLCNVANSHVMLLFLSIIWEIYNACHYSKYSETSHAYSPGIQH